MNSQKYWKERLERLAEKQYTKGDKSLKDLQKLFKNASSDINEKVHSFYSKYGEIKEAPIFKILKDGTKVISGTSKKLVVPKSVADVKLLEGTRLTKLDKQLNDILMQLSKDQNDYMKTTLGGIATDSYYDTIYEIYKGIGVGTSFDLLDPKLINQFIHNPVNGQDFSKRVWNNRDLLQNQVNQILNNGIIQGLPNKEMIRQLSDKMESGHYVAKRLVQTEVTNTYNQASLAGYKSSKIVKKYIYMATLDNKTSDICAELDGKIFELDKAVAGLNMPPMHPNCRSTTVAYFDESDKQFQRMAKNPETGKNFYVPGDMNAKDFRNIFVDKTMTRKEFDKR